MNCIIVDDDPGCIKALAGMIKDYAPSLEVSANAQNIKDAVKFLNANSVDVVFLDVEIGHELGFELFNYINHPTFDVVFTTAHEKYALKAIKSSCFDFLLKPVDIQELLNTVSRLSVKREAEFTRERAKVLINNLAAKDKKVEKLAIPTKDGMVFINTIDVMYLEGDAKYTTLYLNNGLRYVSSKNIGEFEELLDENVFFRCHRSWIVNLNFVSKYLKADNQIVLTNNVLIDVATRKKDEFLRLFSRI